MFFFLSFLSPKQYENLVRIEEQWGKMRCKSCILIIVQHISAHLGPLLATPYVVEACLVPALAKLSGVKQEVEMISGTSGTAGLNLQKAHTLFDFLMASLEVSSGPG